MKLLQFSEVKLLYLFLEWSATSEWNSRFTIVNIYISAYEIIVQYYYFFHFLSSIIRVVVTVVNRVCMVGGHQGQKQVHSKMKKEEKMMF